MSRIIRIATCGECHFVDHKGAFGQVAYAPVCRKANRELPHQVECDQRGRAYAVRKPGIPNWCPLERAE